MTSISSKLDSAQVHKISKNQQVGFWKIVKHIDSGLHEMFVDEIMLFLIGLDDFLLPEKLYNYWNENIINICTYPELSSSSKVVNYTWHHPMRGNILLRAKQNSFIQSDGCYEITEGSAVYFVDENQVSLSELPILQKLIDNLPIGIVIWNNQLQPIACNQIEYEKTATTKEDYLENFYAYSPEFQDNGSTSVQASRNFLQTTFAKGITNFNWVQLSGNNERVHSAVTALKVTDNYIFTFSNFDVEPQIFVEDSENYAVKEQFLYDTFL